MRNSTVIFTALLSTLATPALADGFRFVDGEAVWAYVGIQSASKEPNGVTRSRPEADQRIAIVDGFRYVGGEAGWSYEAPSTKEIAASTARSAAIKLAADVQ